MRLIKYIPILFLIGCGEDPSATNSASETSIPQDPTPDTGTTVTACGISMLQKDGKIYPMYGNTPVKDGVYTLSGWGINCSYTVANGTVTQNP